jgi:hypothetical protein
MIALDGRDAHLGHGFDHAFDRRLDVFFDGGVVINIRQQFFADQIIERFIREIGIDRRAAVADQEREMMHLARFAGFQNQTDLGAGAAADQMMVQTGNRQQGRNGRQRLALTPRSDRITMFAPSAMALSAAAKDFSNPRFSKPRFGRPSPTLTNRQRHGLKTGTVDMRNFSNPHP